MHNCFKIFLLFTFSITQSVLCYTNVPVIIKINQQYINQPINKNTYIDSSYLFYKTYFAYRNKDKVSIIQEYNTKDYHLDKYILLPVQYINSTDSIVTQKLYSNIYTYIDVGEFEIIVANHIKTKSSDAIKSNQQFISIRLLPRQSVYAYLLYKPISYKDYTAQQNIIYNYSNEYDFPPHHSNTYKRNIGFTIQFLFLLGMILIMFIFYVLAYVYLKDKIYLYYTFYLLTTFIQVLYMSQYIFSKNLKMFNFIGDSAVDEATKGLMIFFYSLFYKQAFSISKKERVLYFSIEALKYISLLYVAIVICGHLFSLSLYSEPFVYSLYRFPIFFFSIVILIYTYKNANRTLFQNIIFSGSLVYTLFTALSTLQKINFPFKDFYIDVNILYIGVGLELIIFSIALMISIKDTFIHNEKLKDKLIVELKQNEEFITNENILLEEKVKQRVEEINNQNIIIEDKNKQALLQQFEKEKIEIQMQALSAQMNPHFIFNCMNSIQNAIIQNDNEKASSMLHNFASLIRMVLEKSTESTISLEDEIKLLKTYLNLEQERTGNLFDYEIVIGNNIITDFIRIPVMMLQPFLENSIWHGFKFINYKGKLKIQFQIKNQSLCCSILDNGIGRNKAEEYERHYRLKQNKSLAIAIIENKIKLLNMTNEIQASVEIFDLKDNYEIPIGTEVIITLPIL